MWQKNTSANHQKKQCKDITQAEIILVEDNASFAVDHEKYVMKKYCIKNAVTGGMKSM